jgi:hypothetical protein
MGIHGVIDVAGIMRDYWREQEMNQYWQARQLRNLEWMVLKEWWKCETERDREATKRRYGEILTKSLNRYYESELFEFHKRRRRQTNLLT